MPGRAFEAARRPRFVVQLLEVLMVETERGSMTRSQRRRLGSQKEASGIAATPKGAILVESRREAAVTRCPIPSVAHAEREGGAIL